jgi:hypothetical protein
LPASLVETGGPNDADFKADRTAALIRLAPGHPIGAINDLPSPELHAHAHRHGRVTAPTFVTGDFKPWRAHQT